MMVKRVVTTVILLIFCIIGVICLYYNRYSHIIGEMPSVKAAGDTSKPAVARDGTAQKLNPLLLKLQQNEATVGDLVNGLGQTDENKRHQAAEAIIALHDHYCELTQTIVGDDGNIGDMSRSSAMDVLADLRPHNPNIYLSAIQNISFHWRPAFADFGTGQGYSETGILVRGGLISLSPLADSIAASPHPPSRPPLENQDSNYACLLSILGPATSPWLRQEAAATPNPARKAALTYAAQYTSNEWAKPRNENQEIPLLQEFDSAGLLMGHFDPDDFKGIDIKHYSIKWDAPQKFASGNKNDYTVNPAVEKAFHDTTFIMTLIQYVIMERLEQHDSDRSAGYDLYNPLAQTDAVRVLGCLRTLFGSWVLWERVRNASLHQPIEDQDTTDLKADYRALGQIDIPAVKLLLGRIAAESEPQQQQAATIALSKVAGRYTPFFIQEEIDQRQRWAGTGGKEGNESKRFEAMLKYGTQKKWFTGDFYGVGDPHAYDLVFTQ